MLRVYCVPAAGILRIHPAGEAHESRINPGAMEKKGFDQPLVSFMQAMCPTKPQRTQRNSNW